MSDTIVITGVVFIVLLLLSFMLLVRLQSGGVPAARNTLLIGELWLTAGVIIALLVALSKLLGPPQPAGPGLEGELRDLGARFAALPAESKWLFAAGAAAAVALFAHLLRSLGRAMRAAPP